MIAALYVETAGAYFGMPGVDPWDEARDARKYAGPFPVVAHPPCQRWGRFWHGSTRKPHQFKKGDDNGCFYRAFKALCNFGGVLEHPADSHAWDAFSLKKPSRSGGWVLARSRADGWPCEVWTCCVYQGHYGHLAGKPTWLLVAGVARDALPELRWGKVEQRLHPGALARHGYEKARRIGMMAMVGGKDKTRIRNATRVSAVAAVIGSLLHRSHIMSGQKPVGWITPTGQLFPLASYRPEQNLAYDAHKAGWEHVYRGEKPAAPVTLTPAMRADAAAIGACCDPMSLEVGDPS